MPSLQDPFWKEKPFKFSEEMIRSIVPIKEGVFALFTSLGGQAVYVGLSTENVQARLLQLTRIDDT
jgi:hypothetical protein